MTWFIESSHNFTSMQDESDEARAMKKAMKAVLPSNKLVFSHNFELTTVAYRQSLKLMCSASQLLTTVVHALPHATTWLSTFQLVKVKQIHMLVDVYGSRESCWVGQQR